MARKYDPSAVPSAYRLEDAPARRGDGITQRFFRGVDTLLGMTRVDPGRVGDPHVHPWEQVVYVLDGACTFRVGVASMAVEAGDVFLVPPGYEHAADGGESPCTLLFCGPLREDLVEHTAYQVEFRGDDRPG